MRCPACAEENPPRAKFCLECGTSLQHRSAERPSSLDDLRSALREAIEQQTATSDILRVISRSPKDAQPVLDAVAESAARLCDAVDVSIFRVDGDRLAFVAHHGPIARRHGEFSLPLIRGTVGGRSVLESRTVQVADLQNENREYPDAVENARRFGFRTILSVPLLRDGSAIGGIQLRRTEVQLFSERQVALLQTFADQAVIAIENVRLFKELESRNAALTEALEQQTATSDILRVISGSPTDVQPVLDAVAESAARLCEAPDVSIFLKEAEYLRVAARYGAIPSDRGLPLNRATGVGSAVLGGGTIHVADMQAEGHRFPVSFENARRLGFRTALNVPLMREGAAIGAISLRRTEASLFTERQVSLLETFADQAVIAIENVRLFKELAARTDQLEEKSRQLEVASRHKSEFLANMSHELRTPLNAVIGFSEVLNERMFGDLNDKQAEYLEDIHVSGRHLLSLINDILDLSKVEAGRMELEPTDFDLPVTLDNALTLVRERASRHGIALGLTIDERLGRLTADERKIRQVVLNLLSNAIKFTPDGGRIDVRAHAVNGSVQISVIDTGIGIAPEDQAAIFEEFKQVGTAAKKVEGTGLGLALSRKFIELHGGRIWVQSQVGQGSTFAFTIPLGGGGDRGDEAAVT